MGVVPYIRAPRGNAAAQVATKLNSRIRDHVINSKSDFIGEGGLSLTRPGGSYDLPSALGLRESLLIRISWW